MIATKVEHPVKTDGKWQVFLVSCEGEVALDPSIPPTSFESAMSFCRGWMSGQFVVETTDCIPVPFRVAEGVQAYSLDDDDEEATDLHAAVAEFRDKHPASPTLADINQVNGELSEVAANPFDACDCEPVAALPDLVEECEQPGIDLVDAPTNIIPEKYRTCPWPGWRYADERDIGKKVRVTDSSINPKDCHTRSLLKIDFSSTLPFECMTYDYSSRTVDWKYAYVKLDS